MNSLHPSIHLNQSYQPHSSTSPKSFGRNLDDQLKHKCMNPSSKVHYVPSKRHVNAKKEDAQKRPQRSTIKRAKPKKIWVPKSIIKEIHSQASKEKEKSKTIWIPKSLLKDLNLQNTSKLTFKLPKASTPSSSQHLPKKVSKPYTPSSSKISLPPLTSKPQAISSIFPPFHYPSRCVSMLILPTFSSTLSHPFQYPIHSTFYPPPFILPSHLSHP